MTATCGLSTYRAVQALGERRLQNNVYTTYQYVDRRNSEKEIDRVYKDMEIDKHTTVTTKQEGLTVVKKKVEYVSKVEKEAI